MAVVIKAPILADDFVSLEPRLSERQSSSREMKKMDDMPSFYPHVIQTEPVEHNDQLEIEQISELEVASVPMTHPQEQLSYEDFWEEHRETLRNLEQIAVQDGYQKGYLQGESDAQLKQAEAIGSLLTLVDKGHESLKQLLQASDQLIGEIVFEAVSKIVRDRLITVEGCGQVIAQVIENTLDQEIVTLKISSRDFERLQPLIRDKGESDDIALSRLAKLPIEADDKIELGGCIAELRDGGIDGRIETQMRMFAQSIKDAFKHR